MKTVKYREVTVLTPVLEIKRGVSPSTTPTTFSRDRINMPVTLRE